MARWVRNRNRRSAIKWLIRDGNRLFPTPDHFIEYHDEHGWRKSDWRFIDRTYRGFKRSLRK